MVDRSARDNAASIIRDDDVDPLEALVVSHHTKETILLQYERLGTRLQLSFTFNRRDRNHYPRLHECKAWIFVSLVIVTNVSQIKFACFGASLVAQIANFVT